MRNTKKNIVGWLKAHNVIRDREEERISDEIYERAQESSNWDEWDAYMEEVQSHPDTRVSWWLDKPDPNEGWWKPVSIGGDEYNRKVILVGFNWTGRIAFALERPSLYANDQDGVISLNLPTMYWSVLINEYDNGKGAKFLYNEHGELFCVEVAVTD